MSSSPNAEAAAARLDARAESPAASRVRALAGDRVVQALAALTVVGGILRFATLDARSYWVDEAVTVMRVEQELWTMLTGLVNEESSPPLYFVLAWLWAQVAGSGEIGLRSFSALAGMATIPVVFGVAATLCGRRVGLAAALLASVSPLLVWHAQDARPYALLILLSGLSLLFFVQALENPRRSMLAGWAVVSALALATSYLTFFVVLPAAIWLLLRVGRRRDVLVAVGTVSVAGLALAPYAIVQQGNDAAGWIANQSLPLRVAAVPAQFLVGYQPPLQRTAVVVLGLLALVALWLLVTKVGPRERRGAAVAAVFGGCALAGPLLLALAGFDGFITRTVTAAWIPLVVVAAAGFAGRGAGRMGAVALGAVVVLSLAVNVVTAGDPKFEREDWRGAAAAVGPPADRVVVLSPENGSLPFRYYRPTGRELTESRVLVREIVLIGFGPEHRTIGQRPVPPRPRSIEPPAAGFVQTERLDAEWFTLVRFQSARPVAVNSSLSEASLGSEAALFVEDGRT